MRSTQRRRLRAVAVLALCAIGATAAVHQQSAEAGGNGRNGKFVPESGSYFGIWNRRGEMTQTNVKAQIQQRETQLGRKLDIDHHFHDFTDRLPGWAEQWDVQQGRIPLVAWAAHDTNQINNGSMDAHIRSNARGLRDLGAPVFLRWFWEPEWSVVNAMTNGTDGYINAWRRIHSIFQQEGAANVAFVYCATAWGFVNGKAQSYYPGDAYVDWVCSDGYNWAPAKEGAKWVGFDKIFRPTHDFAVAHNKPMMAGEVGVMEGDPGAKTAWLADAHAVMKTTYPNLAAFVYFDEDRRPLGGYDWRLDSSAGALNAWVTMGRDPHFRQIESPGTTTTATAPSTTVAPTTTTMPPNPPGPLFSDGFESGDFRAWTKTVAASISTTHKLVGDRGALVTTSAGRAYLAANLAASDPSVIVDFRFKVVSNPNLAVPAARLEAADGTPVAALLIANNMELVLRDPRTGTQVRSGVTIAPGTWYRFEMTVNTQTGSVRVTRDGNVVLDVAGSTWVGPSIGRIELGDLGGGSPAKAYSFAYDAVTVS